MLEVAVGPRAVQPELAFDVRVNVDTFCAGRAGGEILARFGWVEERTVFTVFDFHAFLSVTALDLATFGRVWLSDVAILIEFASDGCREARRTLNGYLLVAAEAGCALVPGRVSCAKVDEIISLAVLFQAALVLSVLHSLTFARQNGILIRLVDDELVILAGLNIRPFLDIEYTRRLQMLLLEWIAILIGSTSCGIDPVTQFGPLFGALVQNLAASTVFILRDDSVQVEAEILLVTLIRTRHNFVRILDFALAILTESRFWPFLCLHD